MSNDTTSLTQSRIEEAEAASERASAIALVALLDQILADAIRSRLIKLSKTNDDALFSDQGPLGTFRAKIDMGFALALYGPKTKLQFHTVRRIRNRFAHYHNANHFDHPDILKRCKNLPTHDENGESITDTRQRFNHVIVNTVFRLQYMSEPQNHSRPVPPLTHS